MAVQGLLEPGQNLVTACLRKGGREAVVLTHRDTPECWNVAVYAEGKGWTEHFYFGPELESMQRACVKFIELSSAYVREYPSWSFAPKRAEGGA